MYIKMLNNTFEEADTYKMKMYFPCASMHNLYKGKGYFSKKDYLEFLYDKTFVERDPLYCK